MHCSSILYYIRILSFLRLSCVMLSRMPRGVYFRLIIISESLPYIDVSKGFSRKDTRNDWGKLFANVNVL